MSVTWVVCQICFTAFSMVLLPAKHLQLALLSIYKTHRAIAKGKGLMLKAQQHIEGYVPVSAMVSGN